MENNVSLSYFYELITRAFILISDTTTTEFKEMLTLTRGSQCMQKLGANK